MTSKMLRPVLAASAGALLLSACGGGGGDSGTGTMRVSLTDAPACGFDAVNVTIERVRVHKSSDAQDGDAGWSEVVLTEPKRVDLLSLTNGVLEELGQTVLPAGKYTQMRLVLAPNNGTSPPANSVVPTGGAETPLTAPSGSQTGLKMNIDVDVGADQVADAVIDFDACKSVVKRGNSGQYNLKPVLSVTTVLSSVNQRVEGYVVPAMAADGKAVVSLQVNGVTQKATVADPTPGVSQGKFVLFPVPVGTYDLVVTGTGRVNAVMTGVPVTTTAVTTVSSSTVTINPPSSTKQLAATGHVSVDGSSAVPAASVRVLQTLATVAPAVTMEVANRPVDGLTGYYEYLLPTESPVRTTYVASPAAINFTADDGAKSKYRLQAVADGLAPVDAQIEFQAADIDTPLQFAAP